MIINLLPQRRDDVLEVAKAGDVLAINGEAFDFSTVPEGGTVKADDIPTDWISGDVTREGGEIRLTLILPHGPNPPQEVAFPQPITVTADGPIALPGGGNVDA